MMRLMESGHRKALKSLWAQLDDRAWLEKVASRHRQEFYERRLGSPLSNFHLSIANANEEAAASLIGSESWDFDKRDALLSASVQGSAALIDALASKGASVSSKDKQGMTAAHIAAAAGNRAGLESILRHGADPNATDHRGATPLMLAIGAMSTSCAELLLPLSATGARDQNGHDAKDYAPQFHADPDDPGFEEALRFSRLLQSLEEALALDEACSEAGSVKPRSL